MRPFCDDALCRRYEPTSSNGALLTNVSLPCCRRRYVRVPVISCTATSTSIFFGEPGVNEMRCQHIDTSHVNQATHIKRMHLTHLSHFHTLPLLLRLLCWLRLL